jgi:hypothetical protein
MAQAYPDPVDLHLLSMVMGCDVAVLRAGTAALVDAGLAHARIMADGPRVALHHRTRDGGGVRLCENAADADAFLARLETRTLRALLWVRVAGSRMAPAEAGDLRASLEAVPDGALVDAARVWAHQPVSDWRALIGVLLGHGTDPAAT